MKKLFMCILALGLMLSFTACAAGDGGDTTGSKTMDSVISGAESLASEVGSAVSSMADGDTAGKLKDGKYTAEGKEYDDEGWKPYVEIEVENGKIDDVDIDAVNQKGDFKKEDDKYDEWEDKIELFEDEIKNKGIDKIEIGDDGTVSGINGMDLNVGEYAKLVEEAIEKAKK